ncbi:5-formyltetrahydrofolate cyclo-ligase [Nocardiopsis chromatogenes]|uniref:5-formyltetrahydrofolate cyclo-ligase n=1 Tax=Nocardiopsis chromatogenes TaxID=280239 RepID=UPI0003487A54|nr:5-formyltetrahydrofolate cyclo-ligase [Nocardiopsis chromatogenes]
MDAEARSEKERLRTRLLDARAALSEERRDRAGSALRDAAAEVPELATAGTVAVYYSVDAEPDTRKLVTMLWKRGAYVLLPVFLPDRSLDWAAYEGPDSVAPARFGLLEPTGPRYGRDAVARASVVLAPALAVDRAGARLGRGAGCYDRALSLVGPNTLTLGVIYDTEFLESVPAEPHDRPVDGVLTPEGGLRRL